jgi:hypothetical protein
MPIARPWSTITSAPSRHSLGRPRPAPVHTPGNAKPQRTGQLSVRTTLTTAGRARLRKTGRAAVTVSVQPPSGSPVTKRVVVR